MQHSKGVKAAPSAFMRQLGVSMCEKKDEGRKLYTCSASRSAPLATEPTIEDLCFNNGEDGKQRISDTLVKFLARVKLTKPQLIHQAKSCLSMYKLRGTNSQWI